jgi:cytosine/adenosine deaminase-related metal-dependent hydrolase
MPNDGMLTLGICSRNVGNDPNPTRGTVTIEMAKREWGAARELGFPITLHTSGPRVAKLLDDAGLLGPDVQFVHPMNTTVEDREILAKRGVSYSISPIGESRRPMSSNQIQLAEMLDAGVKVSLSIDHVTTYNCDLFVGMRLLYSLNMYRFGSNGKVTTKRLVELATMDGARDLGIADKVGSLTPGKRADLILVRTTDMNMTPMGDPYDALVFLCQPYNVDTVVVDGRVLRRKNQFTAIDHARIVHEANETIAALRSRAG